MTSANFRVGCAVTGFPMGVGDPQARQTNSSDDPGTWKVRSIPFDMMVEGDNALIYGASREVQNGNVNPHSFSKYLSFNSEGRCNFRM